MSSKSEWTAVHERLMEEQRQRLGPPPTAEEIEAYESGTLSHEEEERVRALLVAYPELARTLVRKPMPEAPQPGDEDYLSKEELAKDWKALQLRIHRSDRGGRVVQFWRVSAAIAATLAVIFGGLLWRARSELGQPQIATEYLLEDDLTRGNAESAPPAVSAKGKHVLLTIQRTRDAGRYRIDILRTASTDGKRVWSGQPARDDRDYFSIIVPSRFLDPGSYKVVVYGVDDAREERLGVYPFRVVR